MRFNRARFVAGHSETAEAIERAEDVDEVSELRSVVAVRLPARLLRLVRERLAGLRVNDTIYLHRS